ncbi:ArnT family glycosyltransferase [Hymenobacter lucidus]|uniref:Glycosyltransferase family 39 protein n=1 Tax=Hymenobacter lucidus TaxID=2880930 RepID=A0ABS8AY05_9BACT|nr:glycosyltransferase family 39 protein [Hymenobacter lucidus]MCB2410658.1 glycosyltransferase family 39 protein [Hymenobacter lucidus]
MEDASTRSIFARSWMRLLTVLAVCGCNFFAHLGTLAVGLMEARNFVAAREMAAGGSWLIPTMNGQLRLAKPPLPTWAVAAVLQLTGGTTDPALLRLPAALMATLLVLFFWGLAKELTRAAPSETLAPGRTAWLAALVLASSLLVVTVGREGHWDIFSNSLAVGSLWLLARGWNQAGPAYASFLGAGLLLGGTILSKGPVSLYTIVLPFVATYAWVGQPDGRARLRRHWRGVLTAVGVAAVVGGAWPMYVWQHVPAAAAAVARTEATAWGERHVESVWYYFNFPVFAGVWTVVALAVLAVPYARRRAGRFVPYALALGWLLASFVLLSIVPEKKERYMLPLLPPLVLLLTGLLRYWEQEFEARRAAATGPDYWLVRGWATVLLLAGVAVPALVGVARLPGFGITSARFILTVLIFAALAGFVAWRGWQQRQATALIMASILSMSALLLLLLPAYAALKNRRATVGLRRLADIRATPSWQHLPWLALDELHVEQVWVAGRPVPTWASPADSMPTRPVLVFAAAPLAQRLPAAWRGRMRVAAPDSFYLGSRPEDGQFFTALLLPISTSDNLSVQH